MDWKKHVSFQCNNFKNFFLKYFDFFLSSIAVPDFNGKLLDKTMVLQYNFRSMVAAEVRNKEMLCKPPLQTPNRMFQMAIASATATAATMPKAAETVAKTAKTPTTTPTIAAPHDFLKGDFFSYC